MKPSNKVLYLALVGSLLIHVIFITNGYIPNAINTNKPRSLQPIELTLKEYTLDPIVVQQSTDGQTIEQIEQGQISKQQRENQAILAQPQANNDTQNKTSTVDVVQASTQKGNLNLTGTIGGPLDRRDPKYHSSQRSGSNQNTSATNNTTSEPQTTSEPIADSSDAIKNQDIQEPEATPKNLNAKRILITEKDIAQNNGLIAPKGNQKLSFPTSAQIKYGGTLPGEMNFQRSGNQYTITAQLKIPFKNLQFKAEGLIINNQFKPTRYTDTRGKNLYAYANFDYENKLITYGKAGEEKTSPLSDNTLDIFSAAWQLALNGGTRSPVEITNGKSVKTYTPDQLGGIDREYNQGEGKLRIKIFTIPNNKKIQYGLAADFGNIPAYINFEGYILDPVGIKLNGQEYWKAVQRVKVK